MADAMMAILDTPVNAAASSIMSFRRVRDIRPVRLLLMSCRSTLRSTGDPVGFCRSRFTAKG